MSLARAPWFRARRSARILFRVGLAARESGRTPSHRSLFPNPRGYGFGSEITRNAVEGRHPGFSRHTLGPLPHVARLRDSPAPVLDVDMGSRGGFRGPIFHAFGFSATFPVSPFGFASTAVGKVER